MASSSSSPCAACKFLRRKCTAECVFAPYFPPDQPHKFANVHKIFGASNITKLLNELPVHQREDAVNSLAYEAEARVKDPVYGCVGAISVLQRQVAQLQNELNIAHNDLARFNGTMIAVQGNASQGLPSTSLPSLGMNLSGPHSREQQQQLLAREQHYLEIPREPQQLTRDQLRDLARGGSYEAGLAAMGMGTIGSLQPYPRQGSDGQPFPRQGNDGQPFSRQGSDGPFPRQGSDGPFPRQGSDGSSGTGMGGGHIPPP